MSAKDKEEMAKLVTTWRTRAKNLRTLRHPRHPCHADDEMQARGMEACARELEDTLKTV